MNAVIQENVPLAPYTTVKLGGAARYFITATTVEDIEAAVDFAQAKQLPLLVLGGGSNVLVSDEGYEGLVVHIQLRGVTFSDVSADTVEVTAAAGEVFDEVVAATVADGLWGLENLSLIPGSVGATPVQNVGAYGVEVADVIVRVVVFNTASRRSEILEASACAFQYRDSVFKHPAGAQYIITSVTFTLSRHAKPKVSYADLAVLADSEILPTVQIIRTTVCDIRRTKFPDWSVVGTAGSFFKNPVVAEGHVQELLLQYPQLPVYPTVGGYCKVSLGYILDKICGLRGFTVGQVALYEKQALVLVAYSGATTRDVEEFANDVAQKVYEKTKISIEREVRSL